MLQSDFAGSAARIRGAAPPGPAAAGQNRTKERCRPSEHAVVRFFRTTAEEARPNRAAVRFCRLSGADSWRSPARACCSWAKPD
ncbi:hypothetical protein ACFPOG_05710 [Paenibacillus aestuarii]|uniref:Uncharacterized protein n=1 Tax=Paenibacillus aestuarii TaxID=516965 RepID=A0ABW0K2U8_9BACL